MSFPRTGLPCKAMLLIGVFVLTPELRAFPGPEVIGQWASVQPWDFQAIHGVTLKNGNVLLIGGNFFTPRVWNPATGQISLTADPPLNGTIATNLFCSGHAVLADGRVAFFGGGPTFSSSHARTVIFDPNAPLSNPWVHADVMPEIAGDDDGNRWYPTATTLADGRVLVTDGYDNAWATHNSGDYPIVFNPNAPAGSQYSSLTSAREVLNWYPFVFQRTNGQLFMGGSLYAPVACQSPCNPPISSDPVMSRNLNVSSQAWSNVANAPIKGSTAVLQPCIAWIRS